MAPASGKWNVPYALRLRGELDSRNAAQSVTLLEAIDKMDKAVGHVQTQFQTVRTGRAVDAVV
mgnify:CR=1 FL=1